MKYTEHRCRRLSLAIGFVPVFLWFGCAIGPNYKRPETSVGSSFVNAPTNALCADEAVLAAWWKGFNDTKLDSLVQRAITNNYDLRIAAANLKESRALRRLATFD